MSGPVIPAITATGDPERGQASLSLNGISLSGIESKVQWDLAVQSSRQSIGGFESYISDLEELVEKTKHKSYKGMILKLSIKKSLSPEEINLKVQIDDLENTVWDWVQAHRYFDYFIRVMQDKIQRDPSVISKDFDVVFRSNEVIQKELEVKAGSVINPVTNTLLSKAAYSKQEGSLKTVRAEAKSLWDDSAFYYADYIRETGRNFPNG